MRRIERSRRVVPWRALIAAAAALAALAPAPGVRAASGSAVLARGWARVTVAGSLLSAAPSTGVLSVGIEGSGTADVFEGGTAWRTRRLSGTRLVHLLAQTVMLDGAGRPEAPDVLRSGDHVAVWGVMTPEEDIMALSVVVATPHPAAHPAAPTAPVGAGRLTGVVTGRSGSMLDLVTDTGTRHAVLVTSATQVRADDLAVAPPIAPFDVVQIDGAVNSDGSVVAARATVQFLASQAAQVSGPIEAVRGDLSGLIVGGTMVCTSTQTYFIRGAARLWIAQMAAGRPVTVYGVPILAGKTPVGLAARVVVVR